MGTRRDKRKDRGANKPRVTFEEVMELAGYETLEELAEETGLSVRTIYNVRHGLGGTRKSTIKLLTMALGRSPKELGLPV